MSSVTPQLNGNTVIEGWIHVDLASYVIDGWISDEGWIHIWRVVGNAPSRVQIRISLGEARFVTRSEVFQYLEGIDRARRVEVCGENANAISTFVDSIEAMTQAAA